MLLQKLIKISNRKVRDTDKSVVPMRSQRFSNLFQNTYTRVLRRPSAELVQRDRSANDDTHDTTDTKKHSNILEINGDVMVRK